MDNKTFIASIADTFYDMDQEINSIGYHLDKMICNYVTLYGPKFFELCDKIYTFQTSTYQDYGDMDYEILKKSNELYIKNHTGFYSYRIHNDKRLVKIDYIHNSTSNVAAIFEGHRAECTYFSIGIEEFKNFMSMLENAAHELTTKEKQ